MLDHRPGHRRPKSISVERVVSGDTAHAPVEKGNERYQIRAVTRALDILVAMSASPGAHELTGLSRLVGLAPPTVLRYLESLKSRGFVSNGPRGYQLGSRLFELGSAFLTSVSIWDHANDLTQHLAEVAQETASVGILDDGQVLYISIAHGQRELGIQSSPGARHPVHCTALGKVILAYLPWSEAEALLLRRPLDPRTGHTITTLEGFRRELPAIAERGYAIDDEERVEGVFCIAAPIWNCSGAVSAAISISGPAFRMKPAANALAQLVVHTAKQGSQLLNAQT